MKTNTHFLSYLAHFFLEWEIFHANIVEKIKKNTHFIATNLCFRISCRFWDNVKKCWAGQATCDNMAHAHLQCLIPNTTNTFSEYVILFALPRHHTSILYVHCLLCLRYRHLKYCQTPVQCHCLFTAVCCAITNVAVHRISVHKLSWTLGEGKAISRVQCTSLNFYPWHLLYIIYKTSVCTSQGTSVSAIWPVS